MNNILIPFAVVNNKIKSIKDIYKQDEAYCLECGEKLLLRNGDKNIKHLAHYSNSDCLYKNESEYKKRGDGESYEHKYAKEFIRDNLRYFRLYGNQIILKDGEFKIGGYKDLKINRIDVEYRGLKEEIDLFKNYIPDILIRTDDVLIALEIYNSNRKKASDLVENLEGKNIYVYEIDINNISVLNFKDIFKNMKLIFSNLMIEYEEAIKPIQNKIIECVELKKEINRKDIVIKNISDDRDRIEFESDKIKVYEINNKQNDYLNIKIKNMKEKENSLRLENVKCWTKCVKDWYSAKLNNQINIDIEKSKESEEEYNILKQFRSFYNGKVGAYSSFGGDEKLKEIATITKSYNSAIKYLGVDNCRFKELVNMNVDRGEQILRDTLELDILEVL